tara:strand:+ start:357 stop:539 length:183 start_codon:yes stop_codon:yes gene_type:complete
MPAKKKVNKKPEINFDTILKKVDDLGRRIEVLEIDIKDMARELMSFDKGLIARIKTRLGL